MAFRGVLLQLHEDAADRSFRVVAPDAELRLPARPSSGSLEASAGRWSQQKLVVTDAVSHKLLQVARFAVVTPQQEEQSVLWGGVEAFPPPGARSVGAAPLRDLVDDNITTGTDTNAPTAVAVAATAAAAAAANGLAAGAALPSVLARVNTLDGQPMALVGPNLRPKRVCFCFHFRSDYEYGLFEHTIHAFSRMQRYTLLRRSVLMEMEISHDKREAEKKEQKRGTAPTSTTGVASTSTASDLVGKRRLGRPPTKKKTLEIKAQQTATAAASSAATMAAKRGPKNKAVVAPPPSSMVCALCPMQKSDGPGFSVHPFVLKDGKGDKVYLCKACLQRVLQKRLESSGIVMPPGKKDKCCGLCSESTDKPVNKVQACTHPMCSRVYCLPCLHKLIGKAQTQKAAHAKNWLCPNCTTTGDDAANTAPVKGGESTANHPAATSIKARRPASTNAKTKQQQKRQRRSQPANSVSAKPAPKGTLASAKATPKSTLKMSPLDYAVTYFKFIYQRERESAAFRQDESEDVCFCCKDGGEVIECDWKGMGGTFARCPKVYHEDCLGYPVPEGKTWLCPRHRCKDCGAIAFYSCRYCVTSYCKEHIPGNVKKLGGATRDIPTSTYFVCHACNEQIHEAVEQKKLDSALRGRLLERRHKAPLKE